MDNFEDINTEMCYNFGKLWNKLYTSSRLYSTLLRLIQGFRKYKRGRKWLV